MLHSRDPFVFGSWYRYDSCVLTSLFYSSSQVYSTDVKKSTIKVKKARIWVLWLTVSKRRPLYMSTKVDNLSFFRRWQSIKEKNWLSCRVCYLWSCAVPVFRFENNTIWFCAIWSGTSYAPQHSFGDITVWPVIALGIHGPFCHKRPAFASRTTVVLFVKLERGVFGSFGAPFSVIFRSVIMVFCPGHYITLIKMPINMVTINPVSAKM